MPKYDKRNRIKPVYDPTRSTRQFIAQLLALADEKGKRDQVAQYLVVATLQLRFPPVDVRIGPDSATDAPPAHSSGFVVGDTAFHVTLVPTPGHFEICKRNLRDGGRVYLLVPDSVVEGARQNAELAAPGRIAVESIESFVANFIELQSQFSAVSVESLLWKLCELFNAVVTKWVPDECLTLKIVHVSETPPPLFIDVI